MHLKLDVPFVMQESISRSPNMRPPLLRSHTLGALCLLALLCAAIASLRYATARQADPLLSRTQPATIIVTNTNDSGPGSLRQALANAQDGDTIQFDPSLNGQTVNLTSGELVINKNITIAGPGGDLLTVSRSSSNLFRIFHVMPGRAVTIEGLTIQNGSGSGGGGVLNDHATLTIDSCIVSGNFAPDSQGAGLYNDGSGSSAHLTILNSTI